MTFRRRDMPTVVLRDKDGDLLECVDDLNATTPTLAVIVRTTYGSRVNLTAATARELRDFLDDFVRKHDSGNDA